MSNRLIPILAAAAVCIAVSGAEAADEPKSNAAAVEFFEKKVRPILVDQCQNCHGADRQKGGLRLDSRDAALTGGDSGAAIIAGNPEKSRLVKAVRYADTDLQMPPKEKLTDEQVQVLTQWVKMGAPWPAAAAVRPATTSTFKITEEDREFWAFQPVVRPEIPGIRGQITNPIDAFVLAKLQEKGLKPAPVADKATLIRRAYFDLIGLPPTPQQVEAYVRDESPNAFAKVIDHLLASPHYGERWGRHWLDVARYGEDQAHTFQARAYPDGWRYRDWVVKAFNEDLPYDRFIQMQIAGDLLKDGDRVDNLAALGYFALGPVYYGRATADELDDRVDTLTRGFLGLTVACARCHDHKFDPIPQKDYYSLAGVFASTDYREYVIAADGTIDDKATQDPVDKMVRDKKQKEKRKPVIHGLKERDNPMDMKVHIRGDPKNLGEEAPRRFLAILAGDNAKHFTHGSGRLELAKAIASKHNPLTARVMVNRIWMHHFGRGLVGTPSNFGSLGERPSHPELLDYLASRFVEQGWSIKKLHRDIMLSAAYQRSSQYDAANAAADSDNRYLWRMNRRRLEVEPWRDAMLAVAGNLDEKLGGPPADLSSAKNNRRTLYGQVSRHNLDPLLRLFDFPDPNLTSDRRPVTSVPLQQLFVLNSPFMAAQAKAFADRVTATASDDTARINTAFLLAYGRKPTAREVELGKGFLEDAGDSAWEKYAQVLLAANEFAFVD